MKTLNGIDLKSITDPCYAEMLHGGCRALSVKSELCRSWKCPFYKPQGCKEWIRVEDKQGINIVPPEEYVRYRRTK